MAATDDSPTTLRRYKKEILHELHKHRTSPFVLILIRDCFQRYDKSRSGQLPAHLFSDCMQAAGNRLSSKAVNLLIAYCIDSSHTADLSRLQALIDSYGDGSREEPQLTDTRRELLRRLEEKFGSGAKAFAFFDEDRDGVIHLADFYQAAISLGFPRRQEDVKAIFQSLNPGSAGNISFSQFMSLFSHPGNCNSPQTMRVSPHQAGIYIQRSKAPPVRWDHYLEEEPKHSLQRKLQLPSDENPSYSYGRPHREQEKIEDLLSHSFIFRRAASPQKSPQPQVRSKAAKVPKLPPFR